MSDLNDIPKGFQLTKIGLIPNDWELVLLGEITTVTRLAGYEFSQYWQETPDGEIIALRGYNIGHGQLILKDISRIPDTLSKKLQRSRLHVGDIVYPCVGTIGNAVVIEENDKYHIQQNIAKITCNERCDPYFLSQFLMSELSLKEVTRFNATSSQPNVLVGSLRQYRLRLPPFFEQQKIAEILNTWDQSISFIQKLINELTLRNKGFSQQLLSGKKRLKGFQEEWQYLRIGDVASQQSILNKSNEEIEVLSCTKYDGLVRSLDYFGRKVFGEDLSKYKVVPNGSFAYATNHIEEGSIGYQNLLDRGLVSPMYTVFKTKPEINDEFFFRFLKTDRMIYAYQSNTSGSIARRGGLRWNDFSTLQIIIPTFEEQDAINSVLTEADKELKLHQQQLDTLKEQKKGLMQKLLTGEIRVKIN